MTWITENPFWLCATALFLVVIFGFLYHQTQNGRFALFAIIALVSGFGFFLVEKMIVTDREGVERLVKELAWNVRNNNMQGVLDRVAPGNPEVTSDIEWLMPQCEFTTCFVSQRPVFSHLSETSAIVEFPVLVSVRESPEGKGNGKVDIKLDLIKIGGQWKIKNYEYRPPNSSRYRRR